MVFYEHFKTKMIKLWLLVLTESVYSVYVYLVNYFTFLGFLNLSKEIGKAGSWISLPEVLILWVLGENWESSLLLMLQRMMGVEGIQ